MFHIFKDLSSQLSNTLAAILESIAEENILSKGETLYRAGEDGDNTGVVLVKGSVSIGHGGVADKTLKSPDILGEMQQLSETGQRVATVRAETPITVLKFSWHSFVSTVMNSGQVDKAQQGELRNAMAASGTSRVQELFELRQ